MNKFLAISLIIIFFITGVGVGYILTPEYSNLKTISTHKDDLGNPDKYLDLRFINGMIAHHKSAIYMLEQVKKESKKTELIDLANFVIDLDTKGIEELYNLKKNIYNDNREITKFNKVNLGSYDENFDLRFLNAMSEHHIEAINVSKDLLSKSWNNETIKVANGAIDLLSSNLEILKNWKQDWYKIN